MTKRRYLRPCIEKVLTVITALIIVFFGMLDDFEMSAIPFILTLLAILVFNFHVLKKYGKGVWMDDDTEEELR